MNKEFTIKPSDDVCQNYTGCNVIRTFNQIKHQKYAPSVQFVLTHYWSQVKKLLFKEIADLFFVCVLEFCVDQINREANCSR